MRGKKLTALAGGRGRRQAGRSREPQHSQFPIIRREIERPATEWTVIWIYLLARTIAVELGYTLDSRAGRVAVNYCESELQRLWINHPLSDSKPERVLSEAQMKEIADQARALQLEWQQAMAFFGDSELKPYKRDELKRFLAETEPWLTFR